MPACFVPGCDSGYTKETTKGRHFFVVPADQLQKWSRHIPRKDRQLTRKSVVCNLHFEDQFLVKYFEHIINGEKIQIPRDRWTLSSGAFPSKFPNCPSYLSGRVPKERIPPRMKGADAYMNESDSSDTVGTTVAPESASKESDINPVQGTVKVTNDSLTMRLREQLYRARRKKNVYIRKCNLLSKENLKLRNRIKMLEKEVYTGAEQMEGVPDKQKLIVQHMLQNKGKGKQKRYSVKWILHCLLLKVRSASTYEFLRRNEYLPLPHQTTLSSYIRALEASFGFDENVFLCLKEKLQRMPERERCGVLMWDEIKLQKHLEFQKLSGDILGFADFGGRNSHTEADHGLVFMFRPHLNGWQQSIGSFSARSAVPGTDLAQLVLQAIIKLEQSGAIVNAVVCDGAATNKSALEVLGVSGCLGGIQNSFTNPFEETRQIYAIIDAPHIIKCIRNNLLKEKIFQLPEGNVDIKQPEEQVLR